MAIRDHRGQYEPAGWGAGQSVYPYPDSGQPGHLLQGYEQLQSHRIRGPQVNPLFPGGLQTGSPWPGGFPQDGDLLNPGAQPGAQGQPISGGIAVGSYPPSTGSSGIPGGELAGPPNAGGAPVIPQPVFSIDPYVYAALQTLIGKGIVVETVRGSNRGKLAQVKPDHIVVQEDGKQFFIRTAQIIWVMPE
ncbi:YuzF family protein [Paenibacillus sp. FJAT-26967]|uniref:YuzF family protein n=1 Tax=Paenibacillus sp. FJAT-26967 TaxID=1729690 RepID=UPI000A5B5951|nr:YuzF family protein [Paenibacillus sp. FJAT-26967]